VSRPEDAITPQTPQRSSRRRIDRPVRLPDRYLLKEVIGSGGSVP
jgi:hypothetical protein